MNIGSQQNWTLRHYEKNIESWNHHFEIPYQQLLRILRLVMFNIESN